MAYTPDQQAAMNVAIAQAAAQAGIATIENPPGSGNLATGNGNTYDQQRTYNSALQAIIQQNPGLYGPVASSLASTYQDSGALSDYSLSDEIGDFADSAASTANAINPFSQQNIGTVGTYLLAAAVILGGIYFFANSKSAVEGAKRISVPKFKPLPT